MHNGNGGSVGTYILSSTIRISDRAVRAYVVREGERGRVMRMSMRCRVAFGFAPLALRSGSPLRRGLAWGLAFSVSVYHAAVVP